MGWAAVVIVLLACFLIVYREKVVQFFRDARAEGKAALESEILSEKNKIENLRKKGKGDDDIKIKLATKRLKNLEKALSKY